mgnify:CR=1 FL=1
MFPPRDSLNGKSECCKMGCGRMVSMATNKLATRLKTGVVEGSVAYFDLLSSVFSTQTSDAPVRSSMCSQTALHRCYGN